MQLNVRTVERFFSYFHHSSAALPLSSDESGRLNNRLVSNHDMFVTEENPSLGLTSVVEHQIHLNPNTVNIKGRTLCHHAKRKF